jgi:hypothetical protein
MICAMPKFLFLAFDQNHGFNEVDFQQHPCRCAYHADHSVNNTCQAIKKPPGGGFFMAQCERRLFSVAGGSAIGSRGSVSHGSGSGLSDSGSSISGSGSCVSRCSANRGSRIGNSGSSISGSGSRRSRSRSRRLVVLAASAQAGNGG